MDDKFLRFSAEGNLEKAVALLEKGANPNVGDEYGYTPLLLAASEGKVELARLLLTEGADVNARPLQAGPPFYGPHLWAMRKLYTCLRKMELTWKPGINTGRPR